MQQSTSLAFLLILAIGVAIIDPQNGQAFDWVPTDTDILKYRYSWNPLSNGPILLTSVDINPKDQFHMQVFGFGETGHQQFDNTLSTHRSDSPFHLNAFEPLVVMGYGISDHIEIDAAFSAISWQSSQPTAAGNRLSTSENGLETRQSI